MRALVALLVLTACAPGKPEKLRNAGGHRPPGGRPNPPHIAWFGRFELTRLPAVAQNGEVVVMPIVENDGGRGFANLRIEVKDRRDEVTDRIDVMSVAEYEAFVPDGVHAESALKQRLATANTALEVLDGNHALVPMREIDPPADLHIDFAARGWLASAGPRCPQCPPCENPPRLAAVYKAENVETLLVRVAYAGTDLCWEPSDQLHVIVR